jgi:hypothetical protein
MRYMTYAVAVGALVSLGAHPLLAQGFSVSEENRAEVREANEVLTKPLRISPTVDGRAAWP